MKTFRLPLIALILTLLTVAGIQGVRFALFALAPLRSGAEPTSIEIHKGEPPAEIARALVGKGVVSDSRFFMWLGRLTRQWPRVRAGEYKVGAGMTPIEILASITSGVSIIHPLTVREGENMYQIADDLAAKGLAHKEDVLELCRDHEFIATLKIPESAALPSLEGYLFPDTYFFNKTLTASDMVRQMVHHFQENWTSDYSSRAEALGFTQLQVVTLASIIEKETGAPEERPLISSVFYNRLHKKMRLQSDATTIYGMWERFNGKIHVSDLRAPNPYNTYTVPALPIGPIANPGREALHAALYPATSDYLFFVSHNDGTHQFSVSLDDHNRAVQKFQVDPKAHVGKSWRDLKKRKAAPKPALDR